MDDRSNVIIIKRFLIDKFLNFSRTNAILVDLEKEIRKNNNNSCYNINNANIIINYLKQILTEKIILFIYITVVTFYKV